MYIQEVFGWLELITSFSPSLMFLSFVANVFFFSETIKEDSCKIISCGSDQSIDITYAYYGIKYWCDASNEVEVLNGKCSGKQSCQICASNSWFGDPCFLTTKHLWYNFACKRKLSTSTISHISQMN